MSICAFTGIMEKSQDQNKTLESYSCTNHEIKKIERLFLNVFNETNLFIFKVTEGIY